MSVGKLLLLLLLIAFVLVAGATALFAFLGNQRGKTEQWAREGLILGLGTAIILSVLVLSIVSIRALNHIRPAENASETVAESVVSFGAGDGIAQQDAVPYTTPEPGTIIRQTPEPERATGVNYGADFDLTACNDYVYLTENATVYAGPSIAYDIIGSLSAGATVKRIGYCDGWSLVDYLNNYAFVSDDVLIITE